MLTYSLHYLQMLSLYLHIFDISSVEPHVKKLGPIRLKRSTYCPQYLSSSKNATTVFFLKCCSKRAMSIRSVKRKSR